MALSDANRADSNVVCHVAGVADIPELLREGVAGSEEGACVLWHVHILFKEFLLLVNFLLLVAL